MVSKPHNLVTYVWGGMGRGGLGAKPPAAHESGRNSQEIWQK